MAKLSWRDLGCAPWFLWTLGITLYWSGKAEAATGFEPDAVVWLMIVVSTAPAWLIVWTYRTCWLVRWGWWIPLVVLALRDLAFLIGPFAA